MAAASTASGDSAAALKPGPKVDEPKTVYDFVCEQIGTKRAIDMAEYSGRVLLIVNTASKCGYTWQYEPLEALYKEYKDRGLTVIGFPCNQFLGQEPGDDATIQAFVEEKYGVTFPMMTKVAVNGAAQDPIFTFLQKELPGMFGGMFGSGFSWNFNKVLIDRTGKPVARFGASQDPKGIADEVEKLL